MSNSLVGGREVVVIDDSDDEQVLQRKTRRPSKANINGTHISPSSSPDSASRKTIYTVVKMVQLVSFPDLAVGTKGTTRQCKEKHAVLFTRNTQYKETQTQRGTSCYVCILKSACFTLRRDDSHHNAKATDCQDVWKLLFENDALGACAKSECKHGCLKFSPATVYTCICGCSASFHKIDQRLRANGMEASVNLTSTSTHSAVPNTSVTAINLSKDDPVKLENVVPTQGIGQPPTLVLKKARELGGSLLNDSSKGSNAGSPNQSKAVDNSGIIQAAKQSTEGTPHPDFVPFSKPPQMPAHIQKLLDNTDFVTRFFIERDVAANKFKWDNITPQTITDYKEKSTKFRQNNTPNFVWQFSCTIVPDPIAPRLRFDYPYLKQSNRAIREHGTDRFLVVEFKVNAYKKAAAGFTKKVISHVMNSGLYIAGRHYEFALVSASQVRENKVTFFNGDTEQFRNSLGDFSSITNPAKLASRWGQIWSSTIPTGVYLEPSDYEVIPDIKSPTGTEFTDGCGEIPKSIAERLAKALGLDDVPSAYQIRWGPVKGVVVINPNIQKVLFRISMKKFEIRNPTPFQKEIEVIRYSKSIPAHLNREFIPLFSNLGVPDDIFLKLQAETIQSALALRDYFGSDGKHNLILDPEELSNVNYQTELKKILMAGHSPEDPYVATRLKSAKVSAIQSLLKKHRYYVPNTIRVLGVYDFTSTLKDGQVFLQISNKKKGVASPIVGKITVTRNPTVHPGDVRLLDAVDVPQLRQLFDVIVFPIVGEGDSIPAQISGGDLDGDEYFCTTHPDFINIKQVKPMNYGALQVTPLTSLPPGDQTKQRSEAVKTWFVSQLFSGDPLGIISNYHATLADHPEYGPMHPHCLSLARAHSRRVDAPKTGDVVIIDKDIKKLVQKLGTPQFIAGHAVDSTHSDGTPPSDASTPTPSASSTSTSSTSTNTTSGSSTSNFTSIPSSTPITTTSTSTSTSTASSTSSSSSSTSVSSTVSSKDNIYENPALFAKPKKSNEEEFPPPIVGKVYQSPGLLGRLFDILWDVLLKVEKENIALNYLDFDLIRPNRENFKSDALSSRRQYNNQLVSILSDDDIEDKPAAVDNLRKDYREKFFHDPRVIHSEDARMDKASAWYCASYLPDSTDTRSFCWLNRMKADAITRRSSPYQQYSDCFPVKGNTPKTTYS